MDGGTTGQPGGDELDRSRRIVFAFKALACTPVSLFHQSRDLVFVWVENPPRDMSRDRILGHRDIDVFPQPAAQALIDAKTAAIESGETQRLELPVPIDGELRWFDICIDPDLDDQGGVQGVFSAMMEVTAQKTREVQLRSLLREVNHRSRNLLAIVLSLATQTARHSTSISGFIADFSGRLQAISRAQDLVTDRDWQGASLSELVVKEVALFRGEQPLAIKVSGTDRLISPSAALYVGLAIHELAAQAVRTGSWRTEPIAVSIAQSGADSLVLEWISRGVAPGAVFEGLPRRFLETVIPLAVDGQGVVSTGGGALGYRLVIGASHFD